MNTDRLTQNSWFALSLLGVEYALLGWYLAAHHIFWLVATFIVVATVVATWKSNPVLESLSWFLRQPLLIVLGVSLLISLIVALLFIQPVLLSLILLPVITLLYALLETKMMGLRQWDTFFWLVTITGLGLSIGEAIDLLVFPSIRY